MQPRVRVLGLGNDLLSDDAFGVEVVRELAPQLPSDIDTRCSIASGLALLDDVIGIDRLIVVDTISSGDAPAGTVHRFVAGSDLRRAGLARGAGGSPHYVGLFETLGLGRALGLLVPDEIVILAVEASDCLTVGGRMSPAVEAAKPRIVRAVRDQIVAWSE